MTEAKLLANEILRSQDLSIVDSTTELLSVEKNKLDFLMSISRDVIYEYSAISDTLILSHNAAEKFGLNRYLVNPYSNEKFIKMFGQTADKGLINLLRKTSPNDNVIDEDIYIDLQSGSAKCHINAITTWSNDIPAKYLGSFGKITFINNEG
jgi:putative two-component system response regulator